MCKAIDDMKKEAIAQATASNIQSIMTSFGINMNQLIESLNLDNEMKAAVIDQLKSPSH